MHFKLSLQLRWGALAIWRIIRRAYQAFDVFPAFPAFDLAFPFQGETPAVIPFHVLQFPVARHFCRFASGVVVAE
jgi:hypothetical protein